MAEVDGPLDAPVRHSSHVPTICTMTCAASKSRAAAISSIDDFDVGAQKLRRAMADRANEMEVAGMAVGRLEPRTAFAEVDLPGDAAGDHPLQRAIDRGAADARMLAADEIEEIVGAQVTFLFQEGPQNLFAFGRALAACGGEARKIGEGAFPHGVR